MTAPALATALSDVLVVELGSRLAVGACGSLLAQLGATVVFVEPKRTEEGDGVKWRQRALWAANKRSLVIHEDVSSDRDLLADLLRRCDVVLTSDIESSAFAGAADVVPEHVIRCDLSAFGTGQTSGPPLSDVALQAWAGLADTTGSPHEAPIVTQLPIIELSSAVYAAAAVVAALRTRRIQNIAQRAEVRMFDCAVTMLATFLPIQFDGGTCRRIGNRHPSISPWNCYRTADGWIQVCTGTEDQWRRLANLLVDDGVAVDPALNSRPGRMQRLDELDELIGGWTAKLPLSDVMARLSDAGIPCGPVHSIAELMSDPNLRHRGTICETFDPLTGRTMYVPGNLFTPCGGPQPVIPSRGEARADLLRERSLAQRFGGQSQPAAARPVLEGIRVLEIGQWTTAPLASRLLAAFGADVVKVEAAEGDPARASPPLMHDKSYLFNLNNSEKRCISLDLRSPDGARTLASLVRRSDVLIENLKPGSLARLGFSFAELSKLNPGIVYCAISGFGAESVYGGRAAMDTVLQAMCGVMDRTRQNGIPYKTGVSISDLLGGYFGLLGTLAALELRDRHKAPQFIDLSMQDLTAWLTVLSWNDDEAAINGNMIPCIDGFLLVSGPKTVEWPSLKTMTRRTAVDFLRAQGIEATPVRTIAEVVADPMIQRHRIIFSSTERNGEVWPLLCAPLHLDITPPVVRNAPVTLDSTDDLLSQWGL